MRAASVRLAIACCAAFGAAGCGRNPAPAGWLPTAEAAPASAFGAWIELDYAPAGPTLAAGGELIAVGDDSVLVLPPGRTLVVIPKAAVRHATVAVFDPQASGFLSWTLIGSLSTLSHGYFLVLSLPVWVLGGTVATGSARRMPLHRVEADWSDVRQFARFPQGLPPDLDRTRLRPKPSGGP